MTDRLEAKAAQGSSPQILMVDDDIALTELVRDELALYGFTIDAAYSGEEALEQVRQRSYALVILDVMLSLMNGFETLSHLRQFSTVPVLMLTARGNPMDVALGLRLGSDDYLAKPFRSEELALRVQAILRRSCSREDFGPSPSARSSGQSQSHLNELQMIPHLRQVLQNGMEVHLTAAEFDILRRLLENPGEIVSRAELCHLALGRDLNPFDRSVDNLVASLRKKLSYGDDQIFRIQSARGKGYFYSSSHPLRGTR